jgi:isopropylmalate/homocitrate/citramalate synthase
MDIFQLLVNKLNDLSLEKIFPFVKPPLILSNINGRADELYLTDTTLRDGQQAWKILSVEESLKIYEILVEIANGSSVIRTTELFLYTPKDRQVVRGIIEFGARYPEPIGWIRASLDELRLVIEAGLQETTILTSISDFHIKYKFGLDREKVIEKYLEVAETAMKNGITPRCTLEDITRADIDRNVVPFVERLIRLSERYGVQFRLKLPDTLGVGLPFPDIPPPRGIPAIIRRLTGIGVSPGNIIFHGHNDFGLAVANSLASWIYGANGVETTIAGIGERAGNTPMEPMLLHLSGLRNGLNLTKIREIPRILEEMGFSIPEFYPVIGRNAFKTKAGIHVDGFLKNPQVYLPFDPEAVLGIKPTVDITPYSGRAAVLLWLRKHVPHIADGIDKDHPLVQQLYDEIVRIFNETKRSTPLSDEEMFQLLQNVIKVKLL